MRSVFGIKINVASVELEEVTHIFSYLIISAKTHKLTQYPVIPPWSQVINKDPFEYKLRSFDEIVKEQEEHPPEFPMTIMLTDHPHLNRENADKSRKVTFL